MGNDVELWVEGGDECPFSRGGVGEEAGGPIFEADELWRINLGATVST